jgi:hypothetical protein
VPNGRTGVKKAIGAMYGLIAETAMMMVFVEEEEEDEDEDVMVVVVVVVGGVWGREGYSRHAERAKVRSRAHNVLDRY